MRVTRRDFGRAALAAAAIGPLRAAIDSNIDGVPFGAQTYSLNTLEKDPPSIVQAFDQCHLGVAELMSNHCEELAGIPRMPQLQRQRGVSLTPEQQAQMQQARDAATKWRASANADTWRTVRRMFNNAGVEVPILCYNTNDRMSPEELEYGFAMAEGLGAKIMSTSTTLTNARRLSPMAKSHKITVAYHGHDATDKPNETAALESYDTLMALGDYNAINLDIGHFTSANYDALAFIRQHHNRIANLHIKDKKRDHGPAVPFGQGDTPIGPVLQLLKREKYGIPAMIEMEYPIPSGSNAVEEVKKCFEYCKAALA